MVSVGRVAELSAQDAATASKVRAISDQAWDASQESDRQMSRMMEAMNEITDLTHCMIQGHNNLIQGIFYFCVIFAVITAFKMANDIGKPIYALMGGVKEVVSSGLDMESVTI